MTLDLHVLPDADAAAAACADHIADTLARSLAARGIATVAFSGGRSPARMFEELGKVELDWSHIHVFQVDERAVGEDHPARNLARLRNHLLTAVSLPAGNLHPMPVGMANLDEAAQRYERALRSQAGRPTVLDVVHLGLGDDGHTASLVPDDPAVDEVDDLVVTVGSYAGHRRLSLTAPVLRSARVQAWLVTGADKATALAGLQRGDGIAGGVVNERAAVFCDEPASGRAT